MNIILLNLCECHEDIADGLSGKESLTSFRKVPPFYPLLVSTRSPISSLLIFQINVIVKDCNKNELILTVTLKIKSLELLNGLILGAILLSGRCLLNFSH